MNGRPLALALVLAVSYAPNPGAAQMSPHPLGAWCAEARNGSFDDNGRLVILPLPIVCYEFHSFQYIEALRPNRSPQGSIAFTGRWWVDGSPVIGLSTVVSFAHNRFNDPGSIFFVNNFDGVGRASFQGGPGYDPTQPETGVSDLIDLQLHSYRDPSTGEVVQISAGWAQPAGACSPTGSNSPRLCVWHDAVPVSEPGTYLLLLSGLMGVGVVGHRRRRKAHVGLPGIAS